MVDKLIDEGWMDVKPTRTFFYNFLVKDTLIELMCLWRAVFTNNPKCILFVCLTSLVALSTESSNLQCTDWPAIFTTVFSHW